MITPDATAPPAARRRPATVTVAFGLQLGVVAALLVFTVLNVVEAVVYDGLIDRAAELTGADPDEVTAERAFNVEWAAIAGVPMLALLALFAATAFPVRSGGNVARIVTCAGAGIPMLCCGLFAGMGALATPLLAMEEPGQPEDEPFWPEDSPFHDSLYDLQSTGAASLLSIVLPVLVVVVGMASVAVAVLLLVPPSNRYYRPPVGPPVTPGYPFAYPVPPGYVLVPIAPTTPGATIPGPPPRAPADPAPPPEDPPPPQPPG